MPVIIPLQRKMLKSMTLREDDGSTIKDSRAAISKDVEGPQPLIIIYSDLTTEIMDIKGHSLWIYFCIYFNLI